MQRPNKKLSDASYRYGLFHSTHARNPDKWNILAVVHDRVTACEEYRVIQPLQELERKGHNIYIMNASTNAQRLRSGIDDMTGADLVLFNRINTLEGEEWVFRKEMQSLRKQGTLGIVDFDDDFRNVHREVHAGKLPDLSGFAAITVTTPTLRDAYGGMNKHIYVIPNMIQTSRFENQQRDRPGLTIGLTGSSTHRIDWQPAAEAVREVLDENPSVQCFVSGYMPEVLAGHPRVFIPKDLRPEYCVDGSGLLVPYPKYPWLVNQIDILLAPVDPEDRFNWHKSPLKVLEGWAANCAVIATGRPLPIYADVIRHYGDGILVEHTKQAWRAEIETLIRNPQIVQRIREAGHAECLKTWDIRYSYREDIYRTIIEREKRRLIRDKEK